MTGWTPEKLAALPECTTVSYHTGGTVWTVVKGKGDAWFYVLMGRIWASASIVASADPGSIRVVSVPVDALLSKKTVAKAARDPHGAAFDPFAHRTIRAAIAHITGGAA